MAKQTHSTVSIGGTDYQLSSHANPKGPPRFSGGDACVLCGHVDHADEFDYYNGKPYCRFNGCNKDIPGLRSKARQEEETTWRL